MSKGISVDTPPDITLSTKKELILTCIGVRQETPTIRTFSFIADQPFRHEAGQALTVAMEIDGATAYRTFSISSAPGSEAFDMTVKAHGDSGATAWMHRTIASGYRLKARPPRGSFTLSRRSGDHIAFVSAGSGSTPLMAMLTELSTISPEADISWVHAARDASEVLFVSRLTELQQRMPNLQVSMVVSRPSAGWVGYRGRLSRRMMSVIAPDFARREVFCCGPSAFMQEMKLIHAAEGGDRTAFHTESFGEVVKPATIPFEAGEAGTTTASFKLSIGDRTLDVRDGETVLQASLRQGVIIPCGCGQGMCGTCRVLKTSGEVATSYEGGITPEEVGEGYILACSSRPLGDVAIVL